LEVSDRAEAFPKLRGCEPSEESHQLHTLILNFENKERNN
jgi:hypothetical protein